MGRLSRRQSRSRDESTVPPRATRPRIRQALELRRWTLGLLADPRAAGAARSEVGRCSVAAWRLFFETEACALAIHERLPKPEVGRLPPSIQRLLRAAVAHELKRALAARAQLNVVAELARQTDTRVAVLKGGVLLLKGRNLHLLDIDLLVRPADGQALVARLEAHGYRSAGWSSPRHLAARVIPGGLRIEIHTTTDRDGRPLDESVWRDLVPLEETPGLWRLSPADHLWQVLTHLVVDHPYRAGRIRDLLVLVDAFEACRSADRKTVGSRFHSHARAAELSALFDAAREMSDGTLSPDRFVETALARYAVLNLSRPLRLPAALEETVLKWTFALLSGPEARREVWSDTVSTPLASSPSPIVAGVERRLPRLGRAWRMSLRLLRLALALAFAIPIAQLARYSMGRTAFWRRLKVAE